MIHFFVLFLVILSELRYLRIKKMDNYSILQMNIGLEQIQILVHRRISGMTAYDKYSTRYLISLYFYLKKNIKKGLLSNAMNQELHIIRQTIQNRGVSIILSKPRQDKENTDKAQKKV